RARPPRRRPPTSGTVRLCRSCGPSCLLTFRKAVMNWNPLSSRRPGLTSKRARRARFVPHLDALESREMLDAASTVFTIDQANSSLALSGRIGSSNIQQQGAGSLTTRYNGAIVANWDTDAGTIDFVRQGTAATALNSGNWQPNINGGSGSAPANYGARVTIVIITANAAVRSLVVSASTSSPLDLTGSGTSFTYSSRQMLHINSGFADYNAGSFGSGRADLANNSAQNAASARGGFQQTGSGNYRLTVPVDLTINQTVAGMQATLRVQGTITANAVLPVLDLNGPDPGFDFYGYAFPGFD